MSDDLSFPGPPGADILLVDDRPANLLALEAILSGVGDRLVRASSGEEALALLAGRDFAVVLLDVRMPGLSGFETAKRMRAADRTRHTPVIFLSAEASDEFPVVEAYRLGAVDYLIKPLVPDVLRAKVAVFVDLFRKGERVRALERERAADALAGKERWLRTVTDSLPTLISYVGADQCYRFANRAYVEWFGLTPEEVAGRHIRDVLGEDVYRHRIEYVTAALRGEHVRFDGPTRHRALGLRDTEVAYVPHAPGGEVEGFFVLVHDVTDRRRAEQAVRWSEERYRKLVEQSPLSTQVLAPDGRTVRVNRAWAELWGATLDEHLVDYNLRTDPQLGALGLKPLIERAFAGEAVELPPVAYTPDRGRYAGQSRWVRAIMYPVRGEGGIEEVVLVHHDITDQRKAEAALRESEERLRLALAAARTGIWTLDVASGTQTRDGNLNRLLGLAAVETVQPFEEFLGHVHPGDREAVRAAFDASARGGRRLSTEFRVVWPDGIARWLRDQGDVVRAGPELRMSGACVDVTDRRRAEQALAESEGRYRTLFTSIDEGFCVIEVLYDGAGRPTDYRFLEVNPAFEKHTGLRDAVGQTVLELAPGHEPHWFETYGQVARTGEPVRFENEAKAIGGRWFDVYAFRLGGSDGRKVAVLFTDITARKRAEDALRESEGRFRTLAAHAPVGIFLTDRDGNCLFVNDRWREMAGLSGDEAHGRGWARALHPDDRERVFREWYAAAEAGRPFAGEYRFRTPDGKVTWLQGSAVGLRGEEGQVAGYIGTLTDVTERREAGEALRQADRRKDEFMAMLAHELRNPLAPIRNSLQILELRGGDSGVVDQVRGMMDRQVTHLGRLVDDLLDVSRLTTGKVQLRKERLDLTRVVRQAVADHRATYEAKGVKLGLTAPETPVWVSGDPTRLAQILDNLLTNALKFTARDGDVSVAVATDSGRATLTVRDTGAGIEAEMLARLFEPFSQADRTLDRSAGGLGLGLAIVKGLAELHGGSVRAESAGLGQGATFLVTLPAYAEPPALTSRPGAPRRATRRLRVLVVEDNRDAADSLQMLLEAYGYKVAVAYSGPDGVKAAERHRPGVVICDIGLPGMDGYRVAQALRGNPATASARLIALTGYGQDEDRRRAREAGFDEHLTKPADPAVLEAILAGAG